MIKIAIWTSGRWDYGYIEPVINELKDDGGFNITAIIPRSHHYCDKILDANFLEWERERNNQNTIQLIRAIHGIGWAGFVYYDVLKALRSSTPDAFIVLGDRFETLSASMAAFLLGIPVIHLQAGDITEGAFDNGIRNAISALAKIHFCANVDAWHNVLSMTGKEAHIVGSPGLDTIDKSKLKDKEQLTKEFDIDFNKPYILACMHPTTNELSDIRMHITNLVNALYRYGTQVIFIYPNIDPKNEIIREIVNKVASVALNKWIVCDNIEHNTFLSLMQYANCMVGNSSAGIIEAAEFNLPVIDVGNRQLGRNRSDNVFWSDYGEEDIFAKMCCIAPKFREFFESGKLELVNCYKGNEAARQIVKILKKELDVNEKNS